MESESLQGNGSSINGTHSSNKQGYGGIRIEHTNLLSTSEHLGKHRQYWRDIILGVNDGLVSTFLLVSGVVGGGLSAKDVLLTAIAGALAGAVSMSAGEYVATKSQNEVMTGEIALERRHIEEYMSDELEELSSLLEMIGISDKERSLKESLLEFYESSPVALLKIMKVLEFGVVEEEQRSPSAAALVSGLLFVTGSLPSVVPFGVIDEPEMGLLIAAGLTIAGLLIVGSVKTWATRGNCAKAALENLVIAGMGGVLAYMVGAFFNHVIS